MSDCSLVPSASAAERATRRSTPAPVRARSRSAAARCGSATPAPASCCGSTQPTRRRAARSPSAPEPGEVAYGDGAAWVLDPARGRALRIDGESGSVTGAVAVGGTPRDVAVVRRRRMGIRRAELQRRDGRAAARCRAAARPPTSFSSLTFPCAADARSPTQSMATAIGDVVRQRGYRAGDHSVGYRICDDSTEGAATFDAEKCAANARTYAADPRIVIEVGPYNSGCAQRQIPIAGAAPNGPLAMVSPTNTDPLLTRDVRPNERRAYTRLMAPEDRVAAAMAGELKARGSQERVRRRRRRVRPRSGRVLRGGRARSRVTSRRARARGPTGRRPRPPAAQRSRAPTRSTCPACSTTAPGR